MINLIFWKNINLCCIGLACSLERCQSRVKFQNLLDWRHRRGVPGDQSGGQQRERRTQLNFETWVAWNLLTDPRSAVCIVEVHPWLIRVLDVSGKLIIDYHGIQMLPVLCSIESQNPCHLFLPCKGRGRGPCCLMQWRYVLDMVLNITLILIELFIIIFQSFNYINIENNCFVNTIAQMLFNLKGFKALAQHVGEGTVTCPRDCYLCYIKKERENRVNPQNSKLLITWDFQLIKGLIKNYKFQDTGDSTDLFELFINRMIKDSENHQDLGSINRIRTPALKTSVG